MFRLAHGYPLDLRHPRTLNEKIQWLKLYNRNPEYSWWADKLRVRECIQRTIGEDQLVPLLAVADNPAQLDFRALPAPYIIKSTHGSGHALIIRDGALLDANAIAAECRKWLRSNLYREGREWHYRDIPPRIIVERLLTTADGSIPFDFKVHCFQGKVEFIQVDLDRYTAHRRNFYDSDWIQLPFTWSVCAGNKPLWPAGRAVAKPLVLSELISLSERIARLFPYVRVDWYVLGDRIYFGEVTFHHGGGFERILPFEWDLKLGDKLRLPVHSSKCANGLTPSAATN